ncbi:M67 family peptidase [Dysgonomonas capnocytophagoides]|uniref:M67 family peptidase n=1 Tax=Dysgonomonas capnocytophagoides TaxID=45254 RepID=A0A4Y8LBT2_9BACT|nr:M67 family metallopeptidase [Dysgonomonas capnocytophagoides]TFD97976.1 M67 family peptidase [Dysgonomonas capnocytophagoides]
MIEIPQHIIDAIIKQAYNELPDEACGLLTGEGNSVRKQYALTNTDHSPEHFSFDPKEQFAVLKEARKDNLQIIANYHSHPATAARPSEEDIRLAYDPDITYIIVSLAEADPVIKAFSIRERMVQPVEIKII